jgi:hypothetical protein
MSSLQEQGRKQNRSPQKCHQCVFLINDEEILVVRIWQYPFSLVWMAKDGNSLKTDAGL